MKEYKWAERVLERNCWGHPSHTELVPIEEADESCRNPCGAHWNCFRRWLDV